MRLVITEDYAHSARCTAGQIAEKIRQKPDALLGFATGTTPIPVYEALVEASRSGEVDFSRVRTVNLDEYAGLAGTDPNSYLYFMKQHLFDPVGIPAQHITIPQGDAADRAAELARLRAFSAAHRSDLQLLGLGVNGHIGFNEPDTVFRNSYHLVELAPSTIESNARLFQSRADVPTKAYTMGIGDIMRAEEVILLATGENKRNALKAVVEEGDVNPQMPASILKFHANCTVYIDKALAQDITPAAEVRVEIAKNQPG